MRLVVLPATFLVLAAGLSTAAAVEGAWSEGTKASVRLLAAGIGADGKLAAGIEIVLPDGWHTYWRSPGDAGIPPVIDFAASTNVASVDVAYPLPRRLDDGFAVTNVYEGRVVLPVAITVADPAAPVELALRMDLGVCDEICVPDTVGATLVVPSAEQDTAVAAELAAARALVPLPAEPGVFAVASVTRDGGTEKRPVFRVATVTPDVGATEIFVEGPPGWAPYRPMPVAGEAGVWTVKFSRRGSEAPTEGASLRLTLASGGRAIEQTIPID